jgi:hypothetical protein
VAGLTVQLEDDSGNVLATTVTDNQGRYTFDQQNGMSATGNYTVSLVLPPRAKQISASPATILISHGNSNVAGVDFTLDFDFWPPPNGRSDGQPPS